MVKPHIIMRFTAKWQAGVNWLSTGDCSRVSPRGEFSLSFWVGMGGSNSLKSSILLPFKEQIKKISNTIYFFFIFC